MVKKILFLVSMRDFEHSKSSVPDVAKQSRLLSSLIEQVDLQIFLDFHVESSRFRFRSKYGWHLRVRLSVIAYLTSNPVLVLRAFHSIASERTWSFKISLPALREAWAELAEGFWIDFFERQKIEALVGVMLNRPELAAAQKLGIPSFELQHGILTEATLKDYFPDLAPDYFCSWPLDSSHVLQPEGLSFVQIPFSWSHNRQDLVPEAKLKVLVLLTNSSKSAFDPFGLLESSLVESVRLLLLHGGDVICRFHPKTSKSEMTAFRRWSEFNGFAVKFETYLESDIANSISNSHFVMMGESTAWLDALSVGRVCFVTNAVTYQHATTQFPEVAGTCLHQELSVHLLQEMSFRACSSQGRGPDFADADFSVFFELLRKPQG